MSATQREPAAPDLSFLTSAYRPGIGRSDAFEHCRKLATSTYENFTVVSWFLPKELRPDMYAVYAFCRTTDDLGDEAPGDRLALLEEWQADLDRALGNSPSAPGHPVMVALSDTVHRLEMPQEPFYRLIEANRRDQYQTRYATYEDLIDYCSYSATPVGRMVLGLWGYRDEERGRYSDATCTALQLANFWQDVVRDYAKGRIYLPQEDMERFEVSEETIRRGRPSVNFRRLMKFECDRAEALFREGERLFPMVRKDLRLDLKLFTAGGLYVLKAIRRQGYDVLTRRPEVPSRMKVFLALRGLLSLKLGIGD